MRLIFMGTPDFAVPTLTEIVGRGHDVEPRAPYDGTFGHAHLIVSENGHVAGSSDPRPRSGMAIGY